MTAQYTSHVPRNQAAIFLCILKNAEPIGSCEEPGYLRKLALWMRMRMRMTEKPRGTYLAGQFVSPWNSHERTSSYQRDLAHSGSVRRSKRTRKLCSGTLYRKPSSAPPMCGIALLPLSTNSSPSTHRGFLNPGCAILP